MMMQPDGVCGVNKGSRGSGTRQRAMPLVGASAGCGTPLKTRGTTFTSTESSSSAGRRWCAIYSFTSHTDEITHSLTPSITQPLATRTHTHALKHSHMFSSIAAGWVHIPIYSLFILLDETLAMGHQVRTRFLWVPSGAPLRTLCSLILRCGVPRWGGGRYGPRRTQTRQSGSGGCSGYDDIIS